MKNKLMMLSIALIAMSNLIQSQEHKLFGMNCYDAQHRQNLLDSRTKEFFNIQKDNQRLIGFAPYTVNRFKNDIAQVAQHAQPINVSKAEFAAKVAQVASSAISKAAHVASKSSILPYVGKTAAFAGMCGYLAHQYAKDQAAAQHNNIEQSSVEQHVANSVAREIADKNAKSLSRLARVKNALSQAGSSVKAQVQAHPRIATGAGLATVAGLSYLAYKKFGKAAKKPVVTKTPEVKKAGNATQVAPKKAKAHKKAIRGYGRR